jgi:hypothetical protein
MMSKQQRFFTYDAFLSHNQGDGSIALAKALAAHGVRAWHDGDADMSDSHVQSVVRQALADARFTCVCIGPHFRDSQWVQAEYSAGLAIEKKFGVGRVVIVDLAPGGTVPVALSDRPRFPAFHDLPFLASFLLSANNRMGIGLPTTVLSQEVIARLLDDARRLRSLGDQHTSIYVDPEEGFKLAHERFVRTVADHADDAGLIYVRWRELAGLHGPMSEWNMRENTRNLKYRNNDYWKGLYVVAQSRTDRSLAVYEFLAVHPEVCHLIVGQMKGEPSRVRDEFFNPLAELLRSPAHRESAARAFSAVASAVTNVVDPELLAICSKYGYDMVACAKDLDARVMYEQRYARWQEQWMHNARQSASQESADSAIARPWWRRWSR